MNMRNLIPWERSFDIPVLHRSSLEKSISSLQKELNHLVDNFFGNENLSTGLWNKTFPSLDIVENDKDFQVRVELPGMKPENIDVSVRDGFITFSGEKKEDNETRKEDFLRRETSYGSFQRTISLPETAQCDQAEANFKNGILSIHIPKKEQALQKPRKLEIKKSA